MSSIAQNLGTFNAPNVAGTQVNEGFTLTTITTETGLRRHTVTTQNRAFYRLLCEQVFDLDDLPDIVAYDGNYSIQFYANDAECAVVLFQAQGGFRC